MVRFKHRYLLCEIVSEDPRCRQCIDERAVSAAAKDAVARTHGDYGLACCSISFTGLRLPLLSDPLSRGPARTPEMGSGVAQPSLDVERGVFVSVSQGVVKYLNAYTGIVLLRCRKDFYRLLWSALPFVTYLENRNQRYSCFFNTLHVGGTIRTCQKFLIQYNRKQLLLLLHNCTSEEERQSIQKSVLSCCLKEVEEEHSQSGDEDDCAETD
ncbi:ribonuclease P/MRP protein subunit POP5 isoform X1 [Dermochelys coriacea]|uniref:ribonuclease P/MRP protein subunit POP5 isoform X1 n=1 Tax=Dermochelys coriacea TaxID=27794 RepID=UPI0018E8632B|nr:ribonuclease P/MRP protein subunit POP5 isoform X1 [Dermochelys coriacea]